MANFQKQKAKARLKRRFRSKKMLYGTADRPRLIVYKSLKHIYAQLIDDQSQRCLTGISSLAKELTGMKASKTEMAGKIGEMIAAKAKEKGIDTVLFDRSGYLYHGRIKAVAEGARKGGLKF